MKKHLLFLPIFLAVLALASLAVVSVTGAPPEQVRVFVQFQPGQATPVRQALQNAGAEFHYEFAELDTFVVSLPSAALEGIQRNPNVVLVEEDAPRYLQAQEVPYGIDMVQARDVWDANRDGTVDSGAPTGAGRLVCIIDSGLYTDHEDFAEVDIVGGYPSGWNTDGCGHGTHVAGTIAAANNDKGVVGVTLGATSLYIVKVFGDSCSWTYSSTLVDAANRCDTAGANIISMSLGGTVKSRTEETTFKNLYSKGILSVAAAGNDGTTRLSYPASYSSVISVAAIDSSEVVADFSQKNSAVELAAPGVGVLSTVPWLSDVSVTVDGITYSANHIENAAYDSASGALVNGGLCSTTGSWSGKVVLCQRGEISFYDKVSNVQKSGGAAAVIYNNVSGNFLGTLGDGYSSTIPAVSLSQEDGQYLVANKLGVSATVNSTIKKPGSGYEAWDGTSMATPHVSGVAALVWSANTSWTNVQIREALQNTAFDLGETGRDNSYGFGLVQAKAALTYLGGGTPPPPPPSGGTLSVLVSTDKPSYVNANQAIITIDVSDGPNPVSDALVDLLITGANGKQATGSGTTDGSGNVVFKWKINSKVYGVGTYTVTATASKEGFTSGSGSTTFLVTK
jgi:serine protease